MLREEEYNDLIRLENMVPGIQLTTDEDVVSWRLTKSKKFTARSLYKFLTNDGISSNLSRKIWSYKIPLKVRIFL
jgi:hypothetical protein